MKIKEYEDAAARTRGPSTQKDMLINGGLGLCGETGEVVDLIKKYIYHGKELPREDLIAELGDVVWYIVEIAAAIDCSLEDILITNVEKLTKRYPNGFKKNI